MLEILSVEQPCILCAQPLEVVTILKDHDTGQERIERTMLDHTAASCAAIFALYRETFPWHSGV